MKTMKFFATLGVVPGYFHANQESDPFLLAMLIGGIWQRHAYDISETTGIFVSAVIKPSLTVYNQDWGCPLGGEQTVSISGECNPTYVKSLIDYQTSVRAVLILTAQKLKQSTTQLTFQEVDFEYFDFRKPVVTP